jgi:hypothetical protein
MTSIRRKAGMALEPRRLVLARRSLEAISRQWDDVLHRLLPFAEEP